MRSLIVVLLFASVAYGLSEICSLKLDPGKCRASHKRYGFDKKEGKCVVFIYGGCGGNNNNFETKEACEKECVMKNAGKKSLKKLTSGDNSRQKLEKIEKILIREEEQKKVGAAIKKAIIKEKLKDSFKKAIIQDKLKEVAPKTLLSRKTNYGDPKRKLSLTKLNLGKPQALPLDKMSTKEQKNLGAAIKKAIIRDKLKQGVPKTLPLHVSDLGVLKQKRSIALTGQRKLNLGKPQILPLDRMSKKEPQNLGTAIKKAIIKEELKDSFKKAIIQDKLKQAALKTLLSQKSNYGDPKRKLSLTKLNLRKPPILPLDGMSKKEQKNLGAAIKKAIIKNKREDPIKKAINQRKLESSIKKAIIKQYVKAAS
ncbi:hypothetical protein RB195_017565 [Necator americanus]